MKERVACTRPKYVCGNEHMKLIGTTDGLFPDFGHHLEGKMGGLWLYPVKILDGFWMRVKDVEAKTVDGFLLADEFENYPYKNVFRYGNSMGHTPIVVERTQLVPEHIDGLCVYYTFYLPKRASNGKSHTICTEFTARINLHPDWLAEEINVFDGAKDEITYSEDTQTFLAKDCDHPWYTILGCSESPENVKCGDELYGSEFVQGNGTGARISHQFELLPGERKTIAFYIAASLQNEEHCRENYQSLISGDGFEEEKKEKTAQILQKTKLFVGNTEFERIFDWIKIHTDWLTLDVKGIGRGITAGIPEYVWWFGCDSCYALQGMLLQGNFEICKETIQLILKYSRKLNGNGKIIHELLPNGVSPNLGNCQETAHFINLLWEYYQWTGDKRMLEEAFDYITMSVGWLLEQDDDNDCFPTGYGIIEIAGLNMEMIDSAVYTATAYACYVKIADAIGRTIDKDKWNGLYEKCVHAINTELWSEEEHCYCDCYASSAKIMEKKDMILEQMEEAKSETSIMRFEKLLALRMEDPDKEYGWLLNRNWVINTPMEMGLAPEKNAHEALERLHTQEFIGSYGMYLEGLRHNHTMTISTGVMAVAQARYGYSDRALELIERIFATYGKATPGSISEMSPDYGCFTQAWTAYGVYVPVVRCFFGICPDPDNNRIYISPKLPSKWENAKLEHIRVLDGEISISIEKDELKINNLTSAKLVVCGNWKVTQSNA